MKLNSTLMIETSLYTDTEYKFSIQKKLHPTFTMKSYPTFTVKAQ